ncbi:hypothetical protein ACFC6H_13265, partial [Enterococcus faecium]
MSEIVYQLSTEDICQFLTNREHLNEVTRRVKQSFSCMEELGYFVNSVEQDGMATVFLTNFIRCRTSFRMLFRLSLTMSLLGCDDLRQELTI